MYNLKYIERNYLKLPASKQVYYVLYNIYCIMLPVLDSA
jgi:hypothetical protein